MENPFFGMKKRVYVEQVNFDEIPEQRLTDEQRKQKRDELYKIYSPLVNEILDQLIEAYQPGIWKKDSDSSHEYCCHVSWFAGPEEKHKASYDDHHTIRRRIEIALDIDSLCNPTSFKITNHENLNKAAHVGISREELVRGIKEVFA